MRYLVLIALIVLVVVVITRGGLGPLKGEKPLTYSELLKNVDQGRIASIEIDPDKGTGLAITHDGSKLSFSGPADQQVWAGLAEKHRNVVVRFKNTSSSRFWSSLLLPLVMVALFFIAMWWLLTRQAQATGGQALSFGRSRARRFGEQYQTITFDDVAGVEEAKQELMEVVEFLREPAKFRALGAKIPKGVLLMGPTGCGKTLLVKAVAGEAKVPFFFISGSDFVEMFVGVGASRVRDLFEQAKQNRPCIVFIDEIDAVGRHRGAGLGGGHDEREQTLNQLLVEMDGFDPNEQIIVMAATNRPDILDPALLRPGRFDRRIVVDQTDIKGRKQIFDIYLKNKPVAEDVDPEVLARRTPGFSGADIENLVNEAALLAARENKKIIELRDFESAIDKVVAGPERKSRIMSEAEKKTLAYHEAGHAVVAKCLPNTDPVAKVSILSRGLALGYTMQIPLEDRYLHTKAQLVDQATSLLGGRAAEELVFSQPTTGGSNDLETVTDLARQMVCQYGMSDLLGPLTFGRKHSPVFLGRDMVDEKNYGEEVAKIIDQEIRALVDRCYSKALEILRENRDILEKTVERLLKKETIGAEELDEIFASCRGGDGKEKKTIPQMAPDEESVAS